MSTERWWTLPHDVLAGLMARAAAGEDPDALLVELYANSDMERPASDDPTSAADRLREWLTDYEEIAAVRAAEDGGDRLAFAADLRAVLDALAAQADELTRCDALVGNLRFNVKRGFGFSWVGILLARHGFGGDA